MQDIGTRLKRYRLSRYAPPEDPLRRKLRWGWIALGLWLVWIGLLSDHSLWRIWRLTRDNAHAESDLRRTQESVSRLESQLDNPETSREQAERVLRERTGMARPGEIIYRIRSVPKGDSAGR